MTDAVNSPQHYQHLPGIEVIDITEHLNFCVGNVVKYVLRADHKGKPLEDLRKAAWYLDREIARRERADALAEAIRLAGLIVPEFRGENFCEPAQDWHPADIDCPHCEPIIAAADAIMNDSEQHVRGQE